jgi:hypothetical protein
VGLLHDQVSVQAERQVSAILVPYALPQSMSSGRRRIPGCGKNPADSWSPSTSSIRGVAGFAPVRLCNR